MVTELPYGVIRDQGHESGKDEYKQEHRAWSYSMRGKTVDGRPLRIVVSFDADDLLIITVIDLEG